MFPRDLDHAAYAYPEQIHDNGAKITSFWSGLFVSGWDVCEMTFNIGVIYSPPTISSQRWSESEICCVPLL
jgi:hypothetical protein